MSADNGIYIHKFSDGWRVCQAGAIENIYWNADKSGYNKKVLWDYFKNSSLFETEAEALAEASKIYKEMDYLEYGICFT